MRRRRPLTATRPQLKFRRRVSLDSGRSHEAELPHTWAVRHDPLTGASDGELERCLFTDSCPKIFNVESANEYWNKSSSLNHTDAYGQDLPVDELAANARLYFISSIQHNTEFDLQATLPRACQQPVNPLYNGPVFRALAVALDQWVSFGIAPPRSVVPMARDGTLVPPQAVRFPHIPARSYAGWPALPVVEFNAKAMNVNLAYDFSKVPPEPTGARYTTLVPQVDGDGNDMAGVRLPFLQAPLGTFTGWSLIKQDFGGAEPDICGQLGQFIPFAASKAERMAAGDPRPSIEERYPTRADYVNAVSDAAASLVRQRFLLIEDYDRMVQAAIDKGTELWKPDAKKYAQILLRQPVLARAHRHRPSERHGAHETLSASHCRSRSRTRHYQNSIFNRRYEYRRKHGRADAPYPADISADDYQVDGRNRQMGGREPRAAEPGEHEIQHPHGLLGRSKRASSGGRRLSLPVSH